jgi:hypothetical protein
MGVNRVTVTRWENGNVRIPNRKWFAFLKVISMTEAEIPKRLEYDPKGYPVGFDSSRFEDLEDLNAEEDALKALEGVEHPARQRERLRLISVRFAWGTPDERKQQVDAEMARFDAETVRINAWNLI